MNDSLGDRMKLNYENVTRYTLPRRTYTIIRLDGCHFHSYTKGLKKPFDPELSKDIDNTIVSFVKEISGVSFVYTQSDEISILLTDFEKETTSPWFGGNLQKMTSVSASIFTTFFNKIRMLRDFRNNGMNAEKYFEPIYSNHAFFDSRVFTIPDRTEVMNYLIWRNQDSSRNSISVIAQSLYSHKELHQKNSEEKKEMIFQKCGKHWDEYPAGDKYGRIIQKENIVAPVEGETARPKWIISPAWKFTEDKQKLLNLIPQYT